MKNVNQFVPLTDNEIQEINGGGPLGGITGNLTTLTAGLSTAVTTLGTGAATSLILAGNGVNNFLTQLGGAIKITV